jgi:hypothetical protein
MSTVTCRVIALFISICLIVGGVITWKVTATSNKTILTVTEVLNTNCWSYETTLQTMSRGAFYKVRFYAMERFYKLSDNSTGLYSCRMLDRCEDCGMMSVGTTVSPYDTIGDYKIITASSNVSDKQLPPGKILAACVILWILGIIIAIATCEDSKHGEYEEIK